MSLLAHSKPFATRTGRPFGVLSALRYWSQTRPSFAPCWTQATARREPFVATAIASAWTALGALAASAGRAHNIVTTMTTTAATVPSFSTGSAFRHQNEVAILVADRMGRNRTRVPLGEASGDEGLASRERL